MSIFKTIFSDPILFRALGTRWYLSKFCLVAGFLLMVIGGLFGVVLALHTKARWRRLSAAEAADVAFNPARSAGATATAASVGTAGAEIQMSIDIDGFRQAARRGDWLTFMLWPIMLSCWVIGVWMVLSTFLLHMPPGFWVLVTVVMFALEGLCLFMPFAALFTNIDAGTSQRPAQLEQKK